MTITMAETHARTKREMDEKRLNDEKEEERMRGTERNDCA